ncbi:MAG: hypothetical protein ACE5JS_16590 [Nitrospinota bacterium]
MVQDTINRSVIPAPIQNFEGINNVNGVLPPDTNGDVGPNHYIQMVNVSFAIYDKTGTLLVGPLNINSLWSGFGGPCEFNNHGDPIVLYDPLANRWLLSQFVAFTNQCIAISKGPDPVASGWWLYDFPTGVVNDYPKFGVWPDAYYMGSQRGYPCCGTDAWAFDRASMLIGAAATAQRFFDPGPMMLPSDLDGSTLPPANAPNVFARLIDGAEWGGVDRLEMYEFSVDWTNPAFSTFTPLPDLPTAPFDRHMCTFGLIDECVPQPGTAQRLETLTAWLMHRLQYRNFGSHETLVVNHSVDVDGTDHAGIRWYELRKSAGTWSINQQGSYAPDSDHRWMGSVAMDSAGNMALGYSVSSSTVFPSIRYTGRLASDPPGTMPQGEATVIAGSGSQTHSSGRWGDYSAMMVDPVDDCTFWYTQEYIETTGIANWQTRIASFKFPSCGAPPPPPNELCWNMSPFIDNIGVNFTQNGSEFLVHGKWVASGSYHGPVVGNADIDIGGGIRFGVHGTFVPGTGVALNCAVDATLDGTLTGPWALECEGGFTNSGTLVPTACPIPLSGGSGSPALNR